jgi:hypothetical protein
LEVWRGEKPKAKDTGEIDRSASLMKIGRTIYDAGATRRTVAEALKERDLALGGSAIRTVPTLISSIRTSPTNWRLRGETTTSRSAPTDEIHIHV